VIFCFFFFFFSSRRRHTRSDRDWSSDVCSSDLSSMKPFFRVIAPLLVGQKVQRRLQRFVSSRLAERSTGARLQPKRYASSFANRSEERRVGKEGRSRWARCE